MAKFRQVNPKNFSHMVPSWVDGVSIHDIASAIDEMLQEYANQKGVKLLANCYKDFWLELDFRNKDLPIRIAEPSGGDADETNPGNILLEAYSQAGGECQVHIPLWSVLKGFPSLKGLHTVYIHSMQGDGKVLNYVGITKQRWFDRLSQHVSSAKAGSRLVFHEAIRQNWSAKKVHRFSLIGVDYDDAMNDEERLVDEFTLYPLGLNMIPGGFAGMRYLYKFGLQSSRSVKDRDAFIEAIAEREIVAGRPNPLCAARWASDQEFVNRIICGHGNRLTVDQVLGIRRLSDFGKSSDEISARLGLSNDRRIRDVIRGARYSRVA
jgi:hypothetical protein